MNTTPLVSILIRTKDRQTRLKEAVASVLAQSYAPIEIVIVNDGGKDFSAEFTEPGPTEIRWVNNKAEHGRSHAANLALEQAAGDYCLFLDDDDSIDPAHIATLVTALGKEKNYRLAYSAVRVMTDGELEETPSFAHAFDPVRLMIENFIPIHAVLFERSLLLEGYRFDPAFDRFEDWDFWLQLAQQHEFLFSNLCTATYRVAGSSGFGAKENTEDDIDGFRLAIYKKWLKRWPEQRLLALINRSREFPRLAVFEKTVENLDANIKEKKSYIDLLREQLDKLQKDSQAQLDKLQKDSQAKLNSLAEDLHETEQEVIALKNYNHALHDELQVIYHSKSWRLTRPLRALTRLRYFLRTDGIGGIAVRLKDIIAARLSRAEEIKAQTSISKNYTPLDFSTFAQPKVSIVIPVYNQYHYTFHCLKSILDHADDIPFEVIVVDDCSSDKTTQMLSEITGINVIRNKENLGFIHSCNKGADAARGEFLVLLNNDTEVRKHWLAALLQTFTDFPDAGLVGARLVFADGTLQEAGGIVWRDGSAWNFGRGEDPNHPHYSYCRQVDYCSGACLMIALNDFRALGKFDTRYVPAYYEDTDLAFKVRESGKKVYYQANASIIHFEGITSGTDIGSGIKQYQQLNHEKFFNRWQDTLIHHRPNGRQPHREKERHVDKYILVIDARVLMPDHDSGSLRMFNVLKILQTLGYKVTFLPANMHYHEKYTPQMQAMGIECQYVPYIHSVEKYLQEFGQQFETVILSRADYAEKYIDEVKRSCPHARIIFDTVDLHFLREQREAELTGDKHLAESAAMRKVQELTIARKADTTLVVSPVELELFKQEAPEINVGLLSNIHQTFSTGKSFTEREHMLFIGNFEHPPNSDAMLYFLNQIFPLVHAQNPDIKLLIVGGHVPASIKARASDHVIITGFVKDIEQLFNDIRISIAPLRYGAGVKGKINSSMSFGVPMVVSPIAAEGMNLEHEKDILIAEQPEDVASEILRLYSDQDLWKKLSDAGKHNIDEHFSFATAEAQLRAVLTQ